MKNAIMLAAAVLVCTSSFAATTGLSKNSSQMKEVTSAFKLTPKPAPTLNSNDITMGYAGEDVAKKIVDGTNLVA